MLRAHFAFDEKNLTRMINRWQKKLGPLAEEFTKEILEDIHKRAMRNLDNSVNVNYWGHSKNVDERIENTKVIESLGGGTAYWKYRLTYTSPHAWIVEHGGYGRISVGPNGKTPNGANAFPIGKQQGFTGKNIIYRKSFKLQEGYHYLERAVRETYGKAIERKFIKYLNRMIK